MFLFCLIFNVNSAENDNITMDSKIKSYKFHMELGCRDTGAQQGSDIDNVNKYCSCVIDTLNKNIPDNLLSEAVKDAYQGNQKEEYEIMTPFFQTASQSCKDINASKDNDLYKNFMPSKALVGAWKVNYFNCSETYEFKQDGTLKIYSRDEITENNYSLIDVPTSTGRNKLTIKTISDNGKKDCANSTKDSTGQSTELFLLINYAGTMAYFCDSETDKRCNGPLEKIKPDQSPKEKDTHSGAT